MVDFPVSTSDEKVDVSDKTAEEVKQLVVDALPTDKRELTILLNGTDKVEATPIVVYRKEDGQIESLKRVVFDAVGGALLSEKMITYTYYDTGEVDEIRIVETDGAGSVTEDKTIKHFVDGTQPEVTHG